MAATTGPASGPRPASSQPALSRPAALARGERLRAGTEAPDFELPRLEIGPVDANGRAVAKVSEETVRLSSFRGKRPVVLIFASYT